MKKIGIIGSGEVAKALAKGFVKYGYPVMIGSRNRTKLQELQKETQAQTGDFEQVAEFGDIIILSVKGDAAESVVSNLRELLQNKVVIDTTNPIAEIPPTNGVIHYFTTLEESLMEKLQKRSPAALFVKAFNSVGSPFMINPPFDSKPTMFICGNDGTAKKEVREILDKFGWETEDMGNVESARAIEPLCILWCIPGMRENKWQHAFKLLKLKM